MGEWMYGSIFSCLSTIWRLPASRPGRFPPWEETPCSHWIGICLDPKAGVCDMEMWEFWILLWLELRPLGRPSVFNHYNDWLSRICFMQQPEPIYFHYVLCILSQYTYFSPADPCHYLLMYISHSVPLSRHYWHRISSTFPLVLYCSFRITNYGVGLCCIVNSVMLTFCRN
jgi:hypothetical protein